MKLRSTLVLLLIVALLGGYVFLVDRQKASTRKLEENSRTLTQFDVEKITGMDITNGDSVVQLRKANGEWRIVSPVQDRAKIESVTPILMTAKDLEKTSVITLLGEDGKLRDAQRDYGVQKGKIRLKLLGEGAPSEIHFGKDTAFEGKIYARLEKDKDVSVIRSDLRNLLTKDVADFRDRHLTHLESSNISGVIFKTPAGEIDLNQKGDDWNISVPIKARASNGKVLDLISNVNTIAIQDFVAYDEASLEKFGLAEPRGTISFQSRDSDARETVEIGGPTEKDPTKIYVRVAGRPSIFVVSKNIGDALAVRPNDLRDRNLCRVSDDLIDRVTIEKAGATPLVFAREETNWKFAATGKPANSAEIKRIIDVLNNTETTDFVDDTGSNLIPYGLDQPVLTVRLSSYSSENTAEAPKGETPLATVQFGKTDGAKLYARVAEEPFLISVAPGVLNNIATTPSAYRPLVINDFDPSKIQQLTFLSPGGTPVVSTRDGAQWKSSIEPAYKNLDSIAAGLARLRAVKWAQEMPAAVAFANAQSISYQSDAGTRKLLLGLISPEGTIYAKFDDEPDVFLLSADTVQTLTPSSK